MTCNDACVSEEEQGSHTPPPPQTSTGGMHTLLQSAQVSIL